MPHRHPGPRGASRNVRNAISWLYRLSVLLFCFHSCGCAALTNPVADGLPVRSVPPEFLGESHEGEQTIPLDLLRQCPPDTYRLAPGDVLGIWIEGILAAQGQLPPVHFPERAAFRFPERGDLPPALGLPIPVREDGTLSLPLIPPLPVQGLSLEQVEAAIRDAYTVKRQLIQAGQERIIVTLMRPRLSHVLVVRHDAPATNLNNNFAVTTVGTFNGETELIGYNTTGSGYVVDLPAYENDVLNALALSGGLPGSNAMDEIYIFRNCFRGGADAAMLKERLAHLRPGASLQEAGGLPAPSVRVPLRWHPGDTPCVKPQDIVLQTGDVVFVEARPVARFYTAGLLPPGEHVLPRDYDLDVIEAIARVRGPLVNGAFSQSNLAGLIIPRGIGNPNPSLLSVVRRTPGGGQINIRVNLNLALRDPSERILVQPGDVLVLQETPGEALARYFTDQFNFNFFSQVIRGMHTRGTITVNAP
jgi:hypothetical protein